MCGRVSVSQIWDHGILISLWYLKIRDLSQVTQSLLKNTGDQMRHSLPIWPWLFKYCQDRPFKCLLNFSEWPLISFCFIEEHVHRQALFFCSDSTPSSTLKFTRFVFPEKCRKPQVILHGSAYMNLWKKVTHVTADPQRWGLRRRETFGVVAKLCIPTVAEVRRHTLSKLIKLCAADQNGCTLL